MDENESSTRRAWERVVARTIAARGIRDERVLAAVRRVPRAAFVPADQRAWACEDGPLPIGHGQTISQPFIVAAMAAWAELAPGGRVLDVGTGSGYAAAVLAEMGMEVYSIEIVPALAARARATLAERGYGAVQVRTGDGFDGWPEAAPFEAILVAAATPSVPAPLLAQLTEGGRLVLPLGLPGGMQELVRVRKAAGGRMVREGGMAVRFVPLTRGADQGEGTSPSA